MVGCNKVDSAPITPPCSPFQLNLILFKLLTENFKVALPVTQFKVSEGGKIMVGSSVSIATVMVTLSLQPFREFSTLYLKIPGELKVCVFLVGWEKKEILFD